MFCDTPFFFNLVSFRTPRTSRELSLLGSFCTENFVLSHRPGTHVPALSRRPVFLFGGLLSLHCQPQSTLSSSGGRVQSTPPNEHSSSVLGSVAKTPDNEELGRKNRNLALGFSCCPTRRPLMHASETPVSHSRSVTLVTEKGTSPNKTLQNFPAKLLLRKFAFQKNFKIFEHTFLRNHLIRSLPPI